MDDKEIKAMSDMLTSLEGLDAQAKGRVFKYVSERLGVTVPSTNLRPSSNIVSPIESDLPKPVMQTETFNDIRSLKEEKRPDNAIQMTALVAYYLQEIALSEEKKDAIDVEDIQKYFKQAGFALPKVPKSALLNTKAAGYLESADRGKYKLNPVGYNLVAYGLPTKTGSTNAKKQIIKKAKKR